MMKALRFKITSWMGGLDFQSGSHGDPFHVKRVLVFLLTGQLSTLVLLVASWRARSKLLFEKQIQLKKNLDLTDTGQILH